jgi:hypothetical protein
MRGIDSHSVKHDVVGTGLPPVPTPGPTVRRLGRKVLGDALAVLVGTLSGIAAAVLGFLAER